MASSPLFMSVDESIVIFGPIVHVGCASASAAVTVASSRARAAAERPAGRRQPDAGDIAGVLAQVALEDRRVLGVDRQQLSRLGEPRDELAADDERLLVGERERLVGRERGDRGAQTGSAHERVEHDVGLGAGRELDDRLGAGLDPRNGSPAATLARARSAAASGRERDARHAELARLREQELVARVCARAHDLDLVGVRRGDFERLAPDRAGRAENRDAKPVGHFSVTPAHHSIQ